MASPSSIEDEARRFLKELQVDPKSREELQAAAKLHRDKKACTEKTDSGELKYKSCCGTGAAELGKFCGVGVRLYFSFIKQMGFVFFLCAVVLSFNLACNIMGNMVNENSALYKFLGSTTIGNLGACEGGRCATDEELQDRCLFNQFPCELRLREATQWLGLADGIGILFVLAWGIYFQNRFIPRVVKAQDEASLTPPDFAVDISVLPYRLAEGHEDYKEKLKQHFLKILSSLGVEDPSAVVDVVLVRDYEGAIKRFLKKGNIIMSCQGDVIRMKQLEGKLEEEDAKRKYDRLEQAAIKKYKDMKAIDRSLSSQAEMTDEERSVVRAFVTFSKESYAQKVVAHYRFSQFGVFRCCQHKELRFENGALLLKRACEPSDLFWENLDFPHWKRYIRVCLVILLTLILLVVCAACLVFFQSLSKTTLASVSEYPVWVVKSSNSSSSCLNFCDLQLFSDRLCTDNGDTSKEWGTVKVFDHFQDYTDYSFDAGCAANWSSPCSSSACGASGVEAQTATDYIGFEFSEKKQVQCWEASLAVLATEVQVFGCPTAPPENRSCWVVEENCAPMYANELVPMAGTWEARHNKLAADMSCSSEVTVEVAKARWESLAKGSEERIQNPIISCFCQQRALAVGPAFAFPPYDTDEKMVCEDWIFNNAMVIAKVLGAAAAVLVINQVLLLIYEFLVAFERHPTVTEVTLSQFWKLFLAQIVNTGLLVLLVNASLELPPVLQFLRALQVGSGQFDELSVTWYVSVGSGICLTIFMQVFSTTVPPLIMAFIVKPCLACIVSRGEVVEKKLNKIYELPPWNLSLRMAQSLTVIFVICMYSGGMPVLYLVGFAYAIVAYWLDKWCLLHGSSKPPAYNESILNVCMNFLPLAAFLHTVVAGWTYGNQALVPSDWSYLLYVVEIVFMSEEQYNDVVSEYLAAPQAAKKPLQWRYYEARMMDMARQGSWLIFCIFTVFFVYYVVLVLYKLLLKPFLSPILFACRESCRGKKGEEEGASWEDCLRQCSAHNHLTSYALSENDEYHAAALAIKHQEPAQSAML